MLESRINDPVCRESVNPRVGEMLLVTVRLETSAGSHDEEGSNSGLFLAFATSGAGDREGVRVGGRPPGVSALPTADRTG